MGEHCKGFDRNRMRPRRRGSQNASFVPFENEISSLENLGGHFSFLILNDL